MVELFGGIDHEGGGLFVMKGAQPLVQPARLLQLYVIRNYIHDIALVAKRLEVLVPYPASGHYPPFTALPPIHGEGSFRDIYWPMLDFPTCPPIRERSPAQGIGSAGIHLEEKARQDKPHQTDRKILPVV